MTFPTDSREVADGTVPSTDRHPGGVSRRRIIKLGAAGGAMVVMSAASRSVFATGGGGVCRKGCTTTPSAFGSINLSRPDKNICGSGLSPGYWKQTQHFKNWPAGYFPVTIKKNGRVVRSATLFSSVFSPTSGVLATATLLEVLSPEMNVVNDAVARSLACALLNAASGRTVGILTVEQVKTIWREYAMRGYYEPTAGIKWYADSTWPVNMSNPCGAGIIGYLETTWT